jgi:hypothetical protein
MPLQDGHLPVDTKGHTLSVGVGKGEYLKQAIVPGANTCQVREGTSTGEKAFTN